jgi:hypothetical protein
MGHLWNWAPSANYTNTNDWSANPYNVCEPGYCSTGESNGRFSDCFAEGGYNAYTCPA